jgi:hypothetical protein
MKGSLPEQAGVIVEHQWDPNRSLGNGPSKAFSSEPGHRQGCEQGSRPAAAGSKKSQRDVEVAGIYLIFERMIAASPHLHMHAWPSTRVTRNCIGHDVLEEILGQPHLDRGSRGC